MNGDRLARTRLLLGDDAIRILQQSKVAIAGLGAVGSYAVEALARCGIGEFVLVDFDQIQPSNINRQLFALESTLGRLKTDVARERILDINPACRVQRLNLFLQSGNSAPVLATQPDLLIDAIDSLTPKLGLLEAAVRAGVPVLSSMGAATRTNPACIHVADLFATRTCPLARFVRKGLRRRGITHGIRCVFSDEPVRKAFVPTEADNWNHALPGRVRNTLGSLSMITGIFGLTLARETVAELLHLHGHTL